MPIDYDNASRTYDQTRSFDRSVVDALAKRAALSERSRVLDFGCGTGNYLVELHCRFSCRCFGVDPSSGMRRAATDKCPELTVRGGDHRSIPFEDASFDLIYLTDVLHHVPDLPQLFAELRRCLAPSGLLCIVTESHSQIAARFYNIYFPSLRENEIRRYPSISKILDAATLQNLIHLHTESLQHACTRSIDPDFIDTVSAKSFSMFHALSATEFTEGLAALIADQGRTFPPGEAGMTLVWFRRASHNGSDLLSR